eukprot:10376061-Lingulodinium_polyedra.AAC.1
MPHLERKRLGRQERVQGECLMEPIVVPENLEEAALGQLLRVGEVQRRACGNQSRHQTASPDLPFISQ